MNPGFSPWKNRERSTREKAIFRLSFQFCWWKILALISSQDGVLLCEHCPGTLYSFWYCTRIPSGGRKNQKKLQARSLSGRPAAMVCPQRRIPFLGNIHGSWLVDWPHAHHGIPLNMLSIGQLSEWSIFIRFWVGQSMDNLLVSYGQIAREVCRRFSLFGNAMLS